MPTTQPKTLSSIVTLISSIFILLASSLVINNIYTVSGSCFESIISFGDSIADTGNLLHVSENTPHFGFPPYGETFFNHPTGRVSDGRLIIDFIAEHYGLPLVPPYFGMNKTLKEFRGGVNYAVAGATALSNSFLAERGIYNPSTNVSLYTEMEWFKQMLEYDCHEHSNCKAFLRSSLFLVGEIGGNDICYAFFQGKTLEEAQSLVDPMINTISLFINELINIGATNLVVPGNFPIGCIPAFLSYFIGSSKENYDPSTGCITSLNNFAEDYNKKLQMELQRLQHLHPHTKIIYADYYKSTMQLIKYPALYGFNTTLSTCCGVGGPYNYNSSFDCGMTVTSSCNDPSSYVSWDGVHMTEASYGIIADGLLRGQYTKPPMNGLCSSKYMVDGLASS